MSESFPCRSVPELVRLVHGLRRIGYAGHLLLLCDDDGHLSAAVEHDGGEEAVLSDAAALLAEIPDAYGLAIVTERDSPVVDIDDELRWEELAAVARANNSRLLQWLVVAGDQLISVAEHAPSPAALGLGSP